MDFKLITFKDNRPELKLDRKWRYCLVFDTKPFPVIAIEAQLTQIYGKPTGPRPYWGIYFGIKLLEWKIKQEHIWYDGPNCSWQYGPFIFQHIGHGDCSKCRESDDL